MKLKEPLLKEKLRTLEKRKHPVFSGFGSQNFIEPAASGVPIILGPSTYNFAKPAEDALAFKAAMRVSDAKEAMELAATWLSDGKLAERSQAAKKFAQSYTGATERMIKEIATLWQKAQ